MCDLSPENQSNFQARIGVDEIYHKLTFSPKTIPAHKLVFWHNEVYEEELCHEE
jgi:hypothetical protein